MNPRSIPFLTFTRLSFSAIKVNEPPKSESGDELDLLGDTQTTKIEGPDVDQRDDWLLSQHPQSLTHKISMAKSRKLPLPNFIGSLPRKDGIYQDDYFMTMLTFFKPWRHGNDLKQPG